MTSSVPTVVPIRIRVLALSCLVLALPSIAAAQAAPQNRAASPQVFTLDRAIQYAVEHYPTVRAALAQVSMSASGVDVARASYLPRLDSLWQVNRATANNIFG